MIHGRSLLGISCKSLLRYLLGFKQPISLTLINFTISIEYEQVPILQISMPSNGEKHTPQATEPKNEPSDACHIMLEL